MKGTQNSLLPHPPPPIVYTIAGSDSGGGAGIQADLHAIHSLGCHGCSVITCLTAQNSQGVTSVFAPPVEFLRKQWSTLVEDLRPRAIKIGMLSSKELVGEVASFLKGLADVDDDGDGEGGDVFVVLDPVMVATSGARLIEDEAKEAIIEHLFPLVDIITPNKFEAEELLGRKLNTSYDIQQGAHDILNMGTKAVIIKGGYTLSLDEDDQNKQNILSSPGNNDVNRVIGHAQDYFLSKEDLSAKECKAGERMCDGSRGLWLRSNFYDSTNTHGTGCTLSSAIASALAIGHRQRQIAGATGGGAAMAIRTVDACCIAKEYVTAGVARGMQLGSGPGPVVHTSFANSNGYFPSVPIDPSIPNVRVKPFLPMRRKKRGITFMTDNTECEAEAHTMGNIIPIVDNIQLVERLCQTPGVTDIQLRMKKSNDNEEILPVIKRCQAICTKASVRLWINDYWKEAIQAGCFGVHLGQEDLARCILNPEDDFQDSASGGGLDAIRDAGLALGISTHSYAELSVALGLAPSYVSLGPIFPTSSKDVGFGPQGVETVEIWRKLLGDANGNDDIPLVVIGGIDDQEKAGEVWRAGADCVAVIGAIKRADNLEDVVRNLTLAME